jgi:hypothetical protein
MNIDDIDKSDVNIPELTSDSNSGKGESVPDPDPAMTGDNFQNPENPTPATTGDNFQDAENPTPKQFLFDDRSIIIATFVVSLIGLINALFPLQVKSILGNIPSQVPFDPGLIDSNIDYNHLNNLLTDRKYGDANQETNRIVIESILEKSSNRKVVSTSDVEDKLKLKNILMIDKLWNKHSSDHYGFNIQSCLWREINKLSPSSPNENVISLFKEIKWINNDLRTDISKNTLNDTKSNKPSIKGYLPRLSWNTESNKPLITILNDYISNENTKDCKN